MNIDNLNTQSIWYESEDGKRRLQSNELIGPDPVEFPRAYVRFPLVITTRIYLRRKDGGYGDKNLVLEFSSSCSPDLVLALATGANGQRAYKLDVALVIASEACERCMNSLAHLYGLAWGYPENGDEWQKTNTECEMCR